MKNLGNLLAVLILSILLMPTIGEAKQLFTDVGDQHAAKKEIDYLAQQKIISGYSNGTFGVNDSITRLQASIMLVRALQLPTANRPDPKLKDILNTHSGYAMVATVVDAGIMTGKKDGSFAPYESLTRAQMASILVRAFQLEGQTDLAFRDMTATHWATRDVQTLYANNITTGYPDSTFRPNATITRAHFSVFLARVLEPKFQLAKVCYTPAVEEKQVIDVAVTTLWSKPNIARIIDRPAISHPVDLASWTRQMTYQQKLGLLGKIDTQALYGQEVTILEEKDNWYKIAVHEQFSPIQKEGYPGWVPKSHVATQQANVNACDATIVTANKTLLRHLDGKPFREISFNTMLPVVKEDEKRIYVKTPTNGTKYIIKEDAMTIPSFEHLPKPTAENLVATSKQFLDLPYLWAGTSGYGFDCSGFTYSIYKQHGILIPRDSAVQATHGVAVAKKDLQVGDLLFFAHDRGKGAIHHVSMYIGNGNMIHSPDYSKPIEIIPITSEPYQSQYAGARRYLAQ